MKIVFCVLLSVTSILAASIPQDSIGKECERISGITSEEVDEINQGVMVPFDAVTKKHAVCIATKTGVMNKKGVIQIDVVKERLKEGGIQREIIEQVVSCDVKESNKGDTIAAFVECIRIKQPKKHSIIIGIITH